MFKLYFVIYLLAHILGDYYLQSDNLAKKKKESILKLIGHCIIYMMTFIVVIIPIYTYEMLISVLVISLFHTAIDVVKYCYIKYWRKQLSSMDSERKVYIIDQAAHLLCLAIVAYIMTRNGYQFYMTLAVEEFYQVTGSEFLHNITWVVMILIIYKPANITIKQMLSMYKPEETEEDNKNNDKKAGGLIGLLERIIILIFLSIGQYSAIGLVLTAKSVARYDKISKDKNFAEYYLLGTLLSTVIVIVVYFVLY